jgi:hypothetical protein
MGVSIFLIDKFVGECINARWRGTCAWMGEA